MTNMVQVCPAHLSCISFIEHVTLAGMSIFVFAYLSIRLFVYLSVFAEVS